MPSIWNHRLPTIASARAWLAPAVLAVACASSSLAAPTPRPPRPTSASHPVETTDFDRSEIESLVEFDRPIDRIAAELPETPDHSSLLSMAVIAVLLAICILSNLLLVSRFQSKLVVHNEDLQEMIRQRTDALLRTRNATIFGLAKLADSRDNATGEHLERIRAYCDILVREIAKTDHRIDEAFINALAFASSLHDIGKVGIPDSILLKPGRLSEEERRVMQRHTLIGGECLSAIIERLGEDDFLEMARDIALVHHERWDGSGYPFGLRGTDIPLAARIVSLADYYDALTSDRVYKNAMDHECVCQLIVAESGGHFDPVVVEAFLVHEKKFRQIAEHAAVDAGSAADSKLIADKVLAMRKKYTLENDNDAARSRYRTSRDVSLAEEATEAISESSPRFREPDAQKVALESVDAIEDGLCCDVIPPRMALDLQLDMVESYLSEIDSDRLQTLSQSAAFEGALTRYLSKADRQNVHILLVEVKDFEPLNERLGPRRAEDLLHTISRRISQFSDGFDIVAHLDAAVFGVAFVGRTLRMVLDTAARIREAFATNRVPCGDSTILLRIDVAAAILQDGDHSARMIQWMRRALTEGRTADERVVFVDSNGSACPLDEQFMRDRAAMAEVD